MGVVPTMLPLAGFYWCWACPGFSRRQGLDVRHVDALDLAFGVRDFHEARVDDLADRHGLARLASAEADSFTADVKSCHGSDSPVSMFKNESITSF